MRFNIFKRKEKEVNNYEGAKAFQLSNEMELYSAVVTFGLNDNFYEKSNDKLNRIIKLMPKSNPEFVAKLATYTRKEMNLRTIPLVLAVELAKQNSGNNLVAKTVNGIVQRADEITELLAYYQMANARTGTKKLNKLSKQIQKGLIVAFNKFDEYQFAKYNRKSEVKLKDALFLVHPKPKDETQQELFSKIANDKLATPYTWETQLSELGKRRYENEIAQKAALRSTWEELILSNKMGYMASLRNLRNILEAEISVNVMRKLCAYLSNETAVKNSKQLPFRFLSAYRELQNCKSPYTSMVLDSLEDVVIVSAANIQGFDYDTSVVIACDVSGSMQKAISPNSKVLLFDVGLMLGMLMQSRCKNVVSGMFGNRWKIINMSKRNVLSNVMEYYRREGEVGYATNGYLVVEDLIKRNEIVDKIMMFTDVQLWNSNGNSSTIASAWRKYKAIAPKAKLYLFDLAGYGNSPLDLKENDVYLIAGWSEKIFDVLASLENGENALAKINAMEL